MTLSPDQMEALCYDRFMQYSGFGDKTKAGEIDGALFAKLCKVSHWALPQQFAVKRGHELGALQEGLRSASLNGSPACSTTIDSGAQVSC